MDLQELERQFGTEEQCLDYLFHLRWKDGYHCPRCQYHEMWQVSNYKYKCKNCGYQTTVLAGTLFQDTHIPLKIWFRAICFVISRSNKVKACELQKELGLGSNRTALMMLSKIRCAMLRLNLEKLQGTVEVGRQQIRNSNPRKYLAVAVEVNHQKAGRIRAGIINDTSFECISEFMKNSIERGSIIQSDCWNGRDQVMNQLYTYRQRLETYGFPYARRAFGHFFDVTAHDSAERIDTYCALYNSQRTPITFDGLLENAVCSQPIPHATHYTLIQKISGRK